MRQRPEAEAALRAHVRACCEAGGYLAGGVGSPDAAWLWGRRVPNAIPEPLPETLRMRVASITKLAVARCACILAAEGKLYLEAPLDLPMKPAPSLAHLLSHRSGLSDAAGYIVEPPETVPAFLARVLEGARTHPPGAYFRYSNLGYVLAGAALEEATGEPLHALLRRTVLEPAGIGGGLNWAGVTDRSRLTMYQRREGRHARQVDGPEGDWDADLVWRDGIGLSLRGYRLGRDTGLMSPQGGLRAALAETARLAATLLSGDAAARLQTAPRWTRAEPGDDAGGLFPAYGLGCTLLDLPGLPRLVGHAGHALGFTGGAWANPETGRASSYALTGSADLSEGQDGEAFFAPEEVEILRHF